MSEIQNNMSEQQKNMIESQNSMFELQNNMIGMTGAYAKQPAGVPFNTTLIERMMAVLIWPVSYLYVSILWTTDLSSRICFGVFILMLMGLTEAFFFERKRSWESIAFMAMTLLCTASCVFMIGSVWEQAAKIFFTHLFIVYWILCRSGRLAEGETSHLFLWDGITGFFVMTFKNFALDVRTIVSMFTKKEGGKKKAWIVILSCLAGIVLLAIALSYLKHADDNFRIFVDRIFDAISFKLDVSLIAKLIMTAFVSMYLYGLLGGCYRESQEQVAHRGENIIKAITKMKKVPMLVWVIFIGLFSLFYIGFFILQGSYLFNAFRMTLPKQYTFSAYARKGFSDMCGVMAVNFILWWIATRTSEKENKALRVASSALIIESMVFALIAFLKLMMYINAYGFTPLRLQSAWFACVLFLACISILINTYTNKKTARVWFITSAASLSVLCLI